MGHLNRWEASKFVSIHPDAPDFWVKITVEHTHDLCKLVDAEVQNVLGRLIADLELKRVPVPVNEGVGKKSLKTVELELSERQMIVLALEAVDRKLSIQELVEQICKEFTEVA